MNISKTARQALIQVEGRIFSKGIEYAAELTNKGEVLSLYNGTKTSVRPWQNSMKNGLICTHNHPGLSIRDTYLSPADIRLGVMHGYREMRAVTYDRFCHLVEIPKQGILQQIICALIATKYELLLNNLFKKNKLDYKTFWNTRREMRKELEKVGGLKFRTIKMPEWHYRRKIIKKNTFFCNIINLINRNKEEIWR